MKADELRELAERVEQAMGPDRDLDHDIYMAADAENGSFATCYTASLDAAMSLVPEEHTIQLSDWDAEVLREKGPWQAIVLPMGARGSMSQFTFSNRCDHAATPALGLTAASLRARASLLDTQTETM